MFRVHFLYTPFDPVHVDATVWLTLQNSHIIIFPYALREEQANSCCSPTTDTGSPCWNFEPPRWPPPIFAWIIRIPASAAAIYSGSMIAQGITQRHPSNRLPKLATFAHGRAMHPTPPLFCEVGCSRSPTMALENRPKGGLLARPTALPSSSWNAAELQRQWIPHWDACAGWRLDAGPARGQSPRKEALSASRNQRTRRSWRNC